MSYGVVPIVTDVGGMPELVEDGDSGLVVPPNDAEALGAAILMLYRNSDRARQMGAAARRRIEKNFNTKQTVAQTGALYQELFGEI